VTWWAWILLWTALVAVAFAAMLVLGRSLWRRAAGLLDELGTAADRLGVLDQELTTLAGRSASPDDAPPDDLAVFAHPTQLRQAHLQARSGRSSPTRPPQHRATVIRPTEPGRACARRRPGDRRAG
jgi:hypothetical protein